MAAYVASLRKVLAMTPSRLLPAHGAAIANPKQAIEAYLAHRQAREEQVLTMLTDQGQDLAALVGRVYGQVRPELERFAYENLLAHLIKVEAEGRAAKTEDGGWRSGRTKISARPAT